MIILFYLSNIMIKFLLYDIYYCLLILDEKSKYKRWSKLKTAPKLRHSCRNIMKSYKKAKNSKIINIDYKF